MADKVKERNAALRNENDELREQVDTLKAKLKATEIRVDEVRYLAMPEPTDINDRAIVRSRLVL